MAHDVLRLPPAERHALVLKPFPAFPTHYPGKSWAGALLRDTDSMLSDRTRANASASPDTDNYLPTNDEEN